MSEESSPIRQYYQEQQLTPKAAARILEHGRSLAKRRRRFFAVAWSLVAAVALCIGGAALRIKPTPSPVALISTVDVQQAIAEYFAFPERPLSHHDSDPVRLRQWLHAKQAPADFSFPGSLAVAQSIGCRVLAIQGRSVSLVCFYADSLPTAGSGTAKIGSSSSAWERALSHLWGPSRPMIHLVVAPRSDFQDPPTAGDLVQLSSLKGWRFVAWTKGANVFIAASDHPDLAIEKILSAM